MIGAIGAQAPVIYQPMVRELATLYLADRDASTNTIINQNVLAGAVAETAAEFGIEFIKETATELLQERGIGLGLSFIPIVGGIAGATLDAIIAKKLTKTVGAMTLVIWNIGLHGYNPELRQEHWLKRQWRCHETPH
jgi:uncharacterized protein (DUF697 family)